MVTTGFISIEDINEALASIPEIDPDYLCVGCGCFPDIEDVQRWYISEEDSYEPLWFDDPPQTSVICNRCLDYPMLIISTHYMNGNYRILKGYF